MTQQTHLTDQDLRALKSIIGDMRFIQAAAMVASKTGDSKEAVAYMKSLARLDKLLDFELKDRLA